MKLCLIGSTRFMDLYVEANRDLTLKGHIVYTVAMMSTNSVLKPTEESPISEAEKQILDLVHLKKILESDGVVLITDGSKYVGFSTKRELQWAQMNGKKLWTDPKKIPSAFSSEGRHS